MSQLYDGATEPGPWYAALDGLRQTSEAEVFHYVAWDHAARGVVQGLANVESAHDKIAEYEEHLAARDHRMQAAMQLPVGGFMLDHEHFSPRAMSHDPVYAWLREQRYQHSLVATMFDDGQTRHSICLLRASDHRPYGDGTRRLLQQLMPDLQRATRLRVRMGHLADRARLGQAVLDSLAQALVVVDADGQVAYLNAAAQRSLQEPAGLQVRRGRIGARAPDLQAHLLRSVAGACGRNGPARGSVVEAGPAHTAPTRGPRHYHVLPLQPTHPLARPHAEKPHALVVWSFGSLQQHAGQVALLLGLSDTEARLAVLLAEGRTVKDFAHAQGCSWHTARTHARNLLHKTGLGRQADVARLVRSALGMG